MAQALKSRCTDSGLGEAVVSALEVAAARAEIAKLRRMRAWQKLWNEILKESRRVR